MKTSTKLDPPINEIARNEKALSRKFTSSQAGNIALAVTDSQNLLLILFGKPVIEARRGTLPDTVKASLALAVESFNLSRAAYSIIAEGYAFQSLALLRAIYERIATILHIRNDDGLARAFLNGEARAQPKYASVMKEQYPRAFDELSALIDKSARQEVSLENVKNQIGRFYGELSRFTHPEADIFSAKFRELDSEYSVCFQYGPRKESGVAEEIITSWLWVLLIMLETVLFTSFNDYLVEEWELTTSHWMRSIRDFSEHFASPLLKKIEEAGGNMPI